MMETVFENFIQWGPNGGILIILDNDPIAGLASLLLFRLPMAILWSDLIIFITKSNSKSSK